MANIRLYRQIYKFSSIGSGTTTSNLIDPYYLSATTNVTGYANIIEEIMPSHESLGIYYVDLNPNLYSHNNTYDVVWYINYINGTPTKRLISRFKVNPINVSSGIDIELFNNDIEIEIGLV